MTGTISDWFPPSLNVLDQVINGFITDLSKFGTGHLILPNANTYTGGTDVADGWITVRHNNALGTKHANQAPTNWAPTTISDGAAVHFRPHVGSPTRLIVPNNFVIGGDGFDHPFDLIDEAGALQNIEANNRLTGIIELDGTAGIGVEQAFGPEPGEEPSQPTIAGYLWDFGSEVGGINKLGSRRLSLQGPGTYTGDVTVVEGVALVQHDTALGGNTGTVTVEPGGALELGNSVTEQTGGLAFGRGIWGETLVLKGAGNTLFGDSPLTVLSGNPVTTGPVNNPMIPTDNVWRGPISLSQDAVFEVGANSRLILAGPIDDANNPAAGGSDIIVEGGGVLELAGVNTFRGTTFVNEGVLIVANGQALGRHRQLRSPDRVPHQRHARDHQVHPDLQGLHDRADHLHRRPRDRCRGRSPQRQRSRLDRRDRHRRRGFRDVHRGRHLRGLVQRHAQGLRPAAHECGRHHAAGHDRGSRDRGRRGGTVVADGASLQLAGSFTVAGEPLQVTGTGAGAVPNVPVNWFQVGPAPTAEGQTPGNENVTGRISATAVDPRDNNIMYIGTAGGGAWKTIDGGQTWRPLFDSLPEIQTVTVNTAGSFTLSFNGFTTGPIDGSSPTLAADIQAELNALASIGGKGANVIVTHTGNVYRVTFNGTLIGTDVVQLTGSVGVTTSTVQQGKNFRFAMYVGSILIDPNNPNRILVGTGDPNSTTETFFGTGVYVSNDAGVTWALLTGNTVSNPLDGQTVSDMVIDPFTGTLYVSSGDRITPDNERQVLDIFLAAGQTFTLSFTHPDANGNVVTLTTAPS